MGLDGVDLRLRQHAAVAHEHHAAEAEAFAQLVHLVWNGGGVRRVARIHIDPHRPPLGVRQQPVDDGGQLVPVAVVAARRQRAFAPVVGAAGDIEEHPRPLVQVAFGQLLLDAPLAFEQPVQRGVQAVLVGFGNLQRPGQRGALPSADGGELRAGRKQALGYHGQHQALFGAGPGAEQFGDAQLLDRAEDELDVAVGQGTLDSEGLPLGDELHAAQRQGEGFDGLPRAGGEVGDGALEDLAALAARFAQEDGRGRIPIGDDVDEHGLSIAHIINKYKHNKRPLHGHTKRGEKPHADKNTLYLKAGIAIRR